MLNYDAILSSAKREHNKNHAGLIGLDITHPELPEFLETKFVTASKVVYVTDSNATEEQLRLFYNYYIKQPKLFMYKRPTLNEGTNLCTEIRMKTNKSTCVLGTFNIAAYETVKEFQEDFEYDFASALLALVKKDYTLKRSKKDNPLYQELVSLDEENYQVGLSITGLFTFLGRVGVSFVDLMNHSEATRHIHDTLWGGYTLAKNNAQTWFPQYKRFFCQAPLVHSHLRFIDCEGLHVTPGIEPLEGYRVGDYKYSRILSQTHGNRMYQHAITTPTVQEISISDWIDFNEWYLDEFIDQSISFSLYDVEGKHFSFDDFVKWYNSSLPSLYYYVPVAYVDDNVVNSKFNEIEIPACDLSKWELLDNDCGCAG
jgi:hypothetical protein